MPLDTAAGGRILWAPEYPDPEVRLPLGRPRGLREPADPRGRRVQLGLVSPAVAVSGAPPIPEARNARGALQPGVRILASHVAPADGQSKLAQQMDPVPESLLAMTFLFFKAQYSRLPKKEAS